MRRRELVALLSLALVVSCQSKASEPTPEVAKASVSHQIHRIALGDHRHVVQLARDDMFVLPSDPAFEWRIDLEDRSAFERVTTTDAGGEAYRLVKTGPFRAMVHGDPKCMGTDGPCGLSKRRWDVTFNVK
jgi:hypothetical protein